MSETIEFLREFVARLRELLTEMTVFEKIRQHTLRTRLCVEKNNKNSSVHNHCTTQAKQAQVDTADVSSRELASPKMYILQNIHVILDSNLHSVICPKVTRSARRQMYSISVKE